MNQPDCEVCVYAVSWVVACPLCHLILLFCSLLVWLRPLLASRFCGWEDFELCRLSLPLCSDTQSIPLCHLMLLFSLAFCGKLCIFKVLNSLNLVHSTNMAFALGLKTLSLLLFFFYPFRTDDFQYFDELPSLQDHTHEVDVATTVCVYAVVSFFLLSLSLSLSPIPARIPIMWVTMPSTGLLVCLFTRQLTEAVVFCSLSLSLAYSIRVSDDVQYWLGVVSSCVCLRSRQQELLYSLSLSLSPLFHSCG